MFDEKDTTRHIHRGARKDPDRTVEVDSSAFFAPETAQPVTPPPSKSRPGRTAPRPGRPKSLAKRKAPARNSGRSCWSCRPFSAWQPSCSSAVPGCSPRSTSSSLQRCWPCSGCWSSAARSTGPRQSLPCLLGLPVRGACPRLRLGTAGPCRAGQRDLRPAHRCRGE